jgi:hypothetical protein
LANGILASRYCLEWIFLKKLLKDKNYYSPYNTNYLFFASNLIIIENVKQQQVRYSNSTVLDFNIIQNYVKEKLEKKEIKFRIKRSDRILIYIH